MVRCSTLSITAIAAGTSCSLAWYQVGQNKTLTGASKLIVSAYADSYNFGNITVAGSYVAYDGLKYTAGGTAGEVSTYDGSGNQFEHVELTNDSGETYALNANDKLVDVSSLVTNPFGVAYAVIEMTATADQLSSVQAGSVNITIGNSGVSGDCAKILGAPSITSSVVAAPASFAHADMEFHLDLDGEGGYHLYKGSGTTNEVSETSSGSKTWNIPFVYALAPAVGADETDQTATPTATADDEATDHDADTIKITIAE